MFAFSPISGEEKSSPSPSDGGKTGSGIEEETSKKGESGKREKSTSKFGGGGGSKEKDIFAEKTTEETRVLKWCHN